MLTAYFDESGIVDDQQLCIVAGFIGNEAQWGSFAADWIPAIRPRPHLHMKKLRWKQHPAKVANDLARLGPIPHRYNLRPVWAGMWHIDYFNFMKGRVRSDCTNPYMACAMRCMARVMEHIAEDDRVLFVFDRQDVHDNVIRSMFPTVFRWDDFDPRVEDVTMAPRPPYGSKLSKNVCFDPADYLAFELREYHLDKDSFKAKAGVSILGDGDMHGDIYKPDHVKEMADDFVAIGMVPGGGPMSTISPRLIKQFRELKLRNHRWALLGV